MSAEGKLKAAFLFIAPDVNPDQHKSWVKTPQVELLAIAAKDYNEATQVAKDLVEQGIQAIELCGGFGQVGVARVVNAVEGKIPVGVVRFDVHPGLGGKSGDDIFGK